MTLYLLRLLNRKKNFKNQKIIKKEVLKIIKIDIIIFLIF